MAWTLREPLCISGANFYRIFPHLPIGAADAVISQGVIPLIPTLALCIHFRDALRALKPGGLFVTIMLSHGPLSSHSGAWIHRLRVAPSSFINK